MENMVPMEAESGGMTVRGYVGRPVLARANRSFEIYFVNGRYIKSRQIGSALDEAYQPSLMLHRYPFVVLYIELPYDETDVNVHPSKMEVRFLNQDSTYHWYDINTVVLSADSRQFYKEMSIGTAVPDKVLAIVYTDNLMVWVVILNLLQGKIIFLYSKAGHENASLNLQKVQICLPI